MDQDVKLKPAPPHRSIFMPLISTMAVVIAALLHKLPAEIMLEMYFPPAHTSLHLIYSPPAVACVFSLPFCPDFPFITLSFLASKREKK